MTIIIIIIAMAAGLALSCAAWWRAECLVRDQAKVIALYRARIDELEPSP